MLMKYVRGSWVARVTAQLLLGASGLALITLLCFRFNMGLASAAFGYLTLITLLCVIGSFTGAVVLSIAAVACLNYFFTPPQFSFQVEYPEDILALAAFLTISLLVTALIARWRTTAEDAEASRRALVDALPALTWTALPDGSRDFHSRRWVEFSGLSAKEAEGHRWAAFFHPDDRPKVVDRWNDAVKTGKPFEIEARGRTAAGEYRVLLVRAEPLRNNKGEIVKWYGVSSDIDDLRRHFRLVVDAAPNAMVMIDRAGIIVMVNTQAERAFGYSRTELVGQPVEMLLPEQFRGHHPQLRKTFFADPQPRPMGAGRDLYGRKKDGSEFPVEIGLNPIETDEGPMVLSAIVDITTRKAAELALRESEQRFRLVVDAAPNAMVMIDRAGIIVMVNTQAERAFGYSRTELVGQPVEMLLPERFRGHHPQLRKTFFADPQPRPMGAGRDLYGRKKDGSEFPVEIGLNPIETDEGPMVLSAIVDITTRKAAELALRESEQRYSVLVDGVTDYAIYMLDPNGIVTNWNRGAQRIKGYRTEEIVGQHFSCFYTEQDRAARVPERSLEITVREGRYETEAWRVRKDGSRFLADVVMDALKDDSGQLIGFAKITRDVTERVKAARELEEARIRLVQSRSEEALRRAQAELAHVARLTSLGELTASIAHEVNQPLAGLVASGGACLNWLANQPPDLEKATQSLERIVRDGKRAGETIHRVRALATKASMQKVPLDINNVVNEVITLVQQELVSHRVSLRTELAPALPLVLADRVQLQQVIINLLMNGIEAMRSVKERPHELVVRSQQDEARHVVVTVEDCGVGISTENASQLFNAFFTTKSDGMGMGFSICRSIIQAHGGRISAANNAGPGATFQFVLPVIHSRPK